MFKMCKRCHRIVPINTDKCPECQCGEFETLELKEEL